MRNLTTNLLRILAIAALFAPFSVGQAVASEYAMTGTVLAKHQKHINIGDMLLLLSPTVKVVIPGKKNAGMNNIKPGDNVGVQMLDYQGKSYVDTIFLLPGGASPANE